MLLPVRGAFRPCRRVPVAAVAVLVAAATLTFVAADAAAQVPARQSGVEKGGSGHDESGTRPGEPATINVMAAGEVLLAGESIVSPNGRYRLVLEHDSNLVLYDTFGSFALWESGTAGGSGRLLAMQPDGNLVIYGPPITRWWALWQSGTPNSLGSLLTVRDNGTVAISRSNGTILWERGGSASDVDLAGVKHIIYGRGEQRVWLVEADGSLLDTYPVSGRANNPRPGTYAVFSKSPKAWSTGGATMEHMVRFAHGQFSDLSIGFHAIPRRGNGEPMQSESELGQFRSLGCVRQRDDKAQQLYEWAPVGTPVLVLA